MSVVCGWLGIVVPENSEKNPDDNFNRDKSKNEGVGERHAPRDVSVAT